MNYIIPCRISYSGGGGGGGGAKKVGKTHHSEQLSKQRVFTTTEKIMI